VAPRLILIGGGARAGKSSFALAYARQLGAPRMFVATAQGGDDEMRARIARHQAERGPDFDTIEEPLALERALGSAPGNAVVVVDCLTLWLSNMLLGGVPSADILSEVGAVGAGARARAAPTLIVTNEVGLGVVPETPLGRRFRDLAGEAHQRLAALADESYLAVLGVVLRLHPAPLLPFRAGETP
jgi:adenosylcobinamide kinase / adenosylcobinamide-phosphate guanylyltransferase